MTVNTAVLKWGMRRLLSGRPPDIRDTATRSWEICPADTQISPPAIYLEGAVDRITDLSPWRNWESERRAIKGGPIEHAATRAYLIENVSIADAYLFQGAARAQEGFGPLSLMRSNAKPREYLKQACLISNWAGSHYFGVFLRASLPMEMLPEADEKAVSLVTKSYTHENGYRTLFSLPRPQCLTSAHIDQLTLYTDYAHNASKADRYTEMRQRMRQTLGKTPGNSAGVYLKRGATGERRIVANEAEIEAALTACGFDIVEPAKLSAEEISRRLLDAPIVVSVEGSHLAHAIYSIADGGAFLVLQPPDRFAMAFKEFTDRAGLRFAFTVGTPVENGHFSVDLI